MDQFLDRSKEAALISSTWPAVPYHVGGAVSDERRFADRKELLYTLRTLAEDLDREGFILSGPRRHGKSSVLERFARIIGSDARVVRLDLLAILGYADVWPARTVTPTVLCSLLDGLEADLGSIPTHCRELADSSTFDLAVFRRRALPDLISLVEPYRLVILIDEMEVAQARDLMAPAELAGSLLPLPGFRGTKPFLGIVWGRPFGRGLARDVPSRLKDFHRAELTRFSSDEVGEALKQPVKGVYDWDNHAVQRVWEVTAGHPLFVASIGAALHAKRQTGITATVSVPEVDDAIKDAFKHAQSWEDAWRQLDCRQQILLRAVAESSGADMDEIISIVRGWGAPYDGFDFEPSKRNLQEDGLVEAKGSGLVFQVPMIASWIHRIDPPIILGTPEDPRDGLTAAAARYEHEGRRYYECGQFDNAARSFEAALELDATRWSAAVWLGQILIRLRQPEKAALMLRSATPTAEVRRVRAQVLAQCLRRALDRHEDTTQLIAEVRTVDPHHQDAPEVAQLVASIQVQEWCRKLEGTTADEAIEATDRYIISLGVHCVDSALRRARDLIELLLEGGSSLEEMVTLICHVVPYLLRESEPSLLIQSSPAMREHSTSVWDFPSNWERCYSIEISALARLGIGIAQLGSKGIPPASLLRLLECQAAATPLGAPLRELVSALASADRLTELALTDSVAARGAANLLEHIDRAQAIERLGQAFSDAALAASTESSQQLAVAMDSLPALGLELIRLLKGREEEYGASWFFQNLITASKYLIERLEVDPECSALTFGPATGEAWQRLFVAIHPVDPAEVDRLRACLDQLLLSAEDQKQVKRTEAFAPRASQRIEKSSIQEILGQAYDVERLVPYRIHGVPPGYVWAWSVNRLGRNLLARAYRVDGGEPSVQAFLAHLWENERRLLSTLATRWEGRALPRLHVSRFQPQQGILVLVTDFVGPQTLRGLLNSGEISRLRRISRAALWVHLQGIVEALGALHRGGYIHRAVRPENILADPDGRSNRGQQWLRLANFEWSVYLYGIANSQAAEARTYDRYVAPEALAIRNPDASGESYAGEGTITDTFALGLMLFECLVEPLRSEELMPVPNSYGISEHREWIEGLLDRVHNAWTNNLLWADEVQLLQELLRPDPSRRCADIDTILDKVAMLAQQETPEQAAKLESPLHLVTAMEIGTKESIGRFIKEELPEVDFPDLPSLSRWIKSELEGAAIRPNRRAGAPIWLEGRSLNFTVQPFTFHGTDHRHVGWLKVAKEHDGPIGAILAHLSTVEVHNYRRDMKLATLLTTPNSWTPWFSAVDRLHEGLTANERAFVDRIRWTIELERSAWERQVLPYERVDYKASTRPGEPDLVTIRDRKVGRKSVGKYTGEPSLLPIRDRKVASKSQTYELVDLMAQSVDRDNIWFELGTSSNPIAAFHPDRRWIQVKSDSEDDIERGLIRLIRHRYGRVEEPPEIGWIRPYSLAGHRTVYERRKEVLADVERDAFLVRSVVTPGETFDDLNLPPPPVFNPRLDADKKALSVAIKNRLPLFVVQGPPGTGKTTLAAEVILQTLREQPSSRILVVAQAHDPLNNLLEHVEKALGNWTVGTGAERRPTSVRLTSEERLDERRYGPEGTRVPREFHPSRVAARIMLAASKWQPGPSDVEDKAWAAWRNLCETQALHGLSRSLERRLITSSNIVYATTNDRRLAAMRPGSFDFVIYEETAKALPIEVLGPLRLARRWLLIGDQAQLPPFGLEDIDDALERDIERLRRERGHKQPLAADRRGVDPMHILGEGVPPQDIWSGISREMIGLLRFFDYVYQRAAKVPLTTTLLPDETESAGAVKGLTGMLTTQWRMHPLIGDFVSKCFYQGRVRNGDPELLASWRRHGLVSPPDVKERCIVWLDIPWVVDQTLATEHPGFGGGWANGFEARVVIGFLRTLLAGGRGQLSLAIMSPYRAQISALAKLIKEYRFPVAGELVGKLHTADSFQGKQADVVMVSLVRNNQPVLGTKTQKVRRGLGFLDSPERSTVIFSRAEKLLIIVGCMKHFKQFPGTRMYDVVTEIESLSSKRSDKVVVLQGQDFIEQRHWEALERYNKWFDEHLRRTRESQDRRLMQENRHEFA